MSFSLSSRGLLATVATAATLAVAPLRAQTISQPVNTAPVYGFGNAGAGFVPTIGQSFVATGPFLTGFTFWLSNEASIGTGPDNTPNAEILTFQGYLAVWDGAGIVGPLLFASSLQVGPTVLSQAYTFNTAPLAVTAGSSYLAFLTVPDLGALLSSAAIEGSDDNSSGGQLFLSSNNDVGALVAGGSAEWLDLGVQSHFAATFSQTTTVPEPATGVLLIAPLLGVVVATRARRRRR